MSGLCHSYERFSALLQLGEKLLAARKYQAAAALAGIAARHAFTSHSGLFASLRLDRLLIELSHAVPAGAEACGGDGRHVLHILTYARPIGGDTRFVVRWIQRDAMRRHTVAVCRTRSSDTPRDLAAAVNSTGGSLKALRSPWSRPLDQALELRHLSEDVDIVFLHLFPDDIAPLLAFADVDKPPPVAIVNHSDHTFWPGGSIANLIVHLRRQAPDFLVERRGLIPSPSVLLPIPLPPFAELLSKEEAKRALGYAPDSILILTIASAFKYTPHGSPGFLDLVLPVLEQNTKSLLLAVGPDATGAWKSANARTEGRVVACGSTWDTATFYAAADIYVDSFPFSSITSLLEAGSHATPLLAYCPPSQEEWLLGPGAPGLDRTLLRASNPDVYRQVLNRLIQDLDYRLSIGRNTRESILSAHTGDGWLEALHNVYRYLDLSSEKGCHTGTEVSFRAGNLDEAVASVIACISVGLSPIIDAYVAPLPYRSRISTLRKLFYQQFDFSLSMFLPPVLERCLGGKAPWLGHMLRRLFSSRIG